MKILQAIVASAVETLDGRQGFGLVCCSHALPKELRQEASDIGYSRDAGGLPIFSLKITEAAGASWILMNRTVPAVDFTGRASYLSHSLALEETSFHDFFPEGSPVTSVFEFMRHYAWLSSWEGQPKLLEPTEDIDIAELRARNYGASKEEEALAPSFLLAFDYSGDPPKPRRAVWQLEGMNPDNMLELFHQTWFCIDPWCSTKKYSSYLPEPPLSMRDSWKCSFTTNLGNRQSNAYLWVVASPSCESIPNRDIIDPTQWQSETSESIKEKIGSDHGVLLVERCILGPKAWANNALQAKLVEMRSEFAERMKQSNSNFYAEANDVIDRIKSYIEKDREFVLWGEQRQWWSYNYEQDVNQWREDLTNLEQKARNENETEFHSIQKELNPILLLIGEKEQIKDDPQDCDKPVFFTNEFEHFRILAQEFKEQRRIVSLLDIANKLEERNVRLQENSVNLDAQVKTADSEKMQLHEKWTEAQNNVNKLGKDIALLSNENAKYKKIIELNNANARKRPKWQSGKGIAIICSAAAVVLLLAYYMTLFFQQPDNAAKQLSEESTKKMPVENHESDSRIRELEIENKRLEMDNKSLVKKVESQKTVDSFDKGKTAAESPLPDDKKPKEEKAGGDLKTTDNKKPKEVEQGKDTKPVDDNQNIQAKPLTPSNAIEVKPVLPEPSNPNAQATTKPPVPDVQKTPVEQREKPAPEAKTPDQKQ
jgi:hypothetical protein